MQGLLITDGFNFVVKNYSDDETIRYEEVKKDLDNGRLELTNMGPDAHALIDEEGKGKGLRLNVLADCMYRYVNSLPPNFPDCIVGPMIVFSTKRCELELTHTDVNPVFVELVQAMRTRYFQLVAQSN